MEVLGLRLFGDCYRDKRVLITGHTGFKGSWLALWLHELGAIVTGIALAPDTNPNHWDLVNLPIEDYRVDIRDADAVKAHIEKSQPEIVFHLAAQPLVRRSYRAPLETWSTNVMGTAHVLEACRNVTSVKAIVAITTDKCYENQEWTWGYRESDRLGGHDPYSASKAGAELIVASYRRSFFGEPNSTLLATARAGNVIGGGDWSEDRLIPDLVRAMKENYSLEIRMPNATRPWQHVLESLSGYLLLGQKLILGDQSFADAWNFGPDTEDNRKVSEVLVKLKERWEPLRWYVSDQAQYHETSLLYLDSSKARTMLGWRPVWDLNTALNHTADWYQAWLTNGKVLSRAQLFQYIADARNNGVEWAQA